MPKSILSVPSAPAPLGPYSPAVEAQGLVYLSGQVALDPDTGSSVGEDVADQTHQVMGNIGAMLGDVGLGYDDIVKTTIFLIDIADFAKVNDAYAAYVGASRPARSTVGVAALPGGFRVEIEVIAAR
ncbi:MAG: reactive intermediate/imine deaminase [Acidimicrobiia bacterium]|nr:reactive intermediate/imine deaminase [Acidimicrobiia bacterium]